MEESELQRWPQNLSPSSRRSNDTNSSPEFEFWMVRNPSFPQPDLHSADELFSDGIILPLHRLHHQFSTDPHDQNTPPLPPTPPQEEEQIGSDRPISEQNAGPEISAGLNNLSASAFTSSKRWKDLFKKSDKKNSENGEIVVNNKEKKKEKKSNANVTSGAGNSGVTAAELNINIWPFRRSRSAGNGGIRPRMSAMPRKVSSAPCSRSNSAGESKSRKWPSSPSRGGVHLGRSSPVWQVRRGATASASATAAGARSSDAVSKGAEKGVRKEGNESRLQNSVSGGTAATRGSGGVPKARVVNINVPMCIGYRHQLSCRSDENSAICVAAAATVAATGGDGGGDRQSGGASSSEGVRSSNLFNIRSLFTKKVY